MAPKTRPLSVALQGGGAHGAFTWGVLDRLLEDGRFDLRAVTGTSAGAVNAAALAYGLLIGGPDGARETLSAVWTGVGEKGPDRSFIAGADDDPELSVVARMAKMMTSSLSPSQLNPWKFDPLRDVLLEHIDFDKLRRSRKGIDIRLAATDALSGRMRLFSRKELTVEAVLASACLPRISHAVIIDDRPYWDGGYSANPPLLPLLDSEPEDALVILIVRTDHEEVPESSAEISARESEFAFGSGFLRETEMLASATQRAEESKWPFVGKLEKRLRRMRWHVINGAEVTGELNPESRLIAYLPFLESLHDSGRDYADAWLAEKAKAIGHHSSASLANFRQLD